jgi:regulatory protein
VLDGAISPEEDDASRTASAAPLTPTERLEKALGLAYRHLGKRDRTVADVRGHLTAKDTPDAIVDDAIAELRTQGYLDDARFARRFAEDRRSLDGWGSERIAQRLRAAGVPAGDIEAAMATAVPAGDELDAALEVLSGRFPEPPEELRDRQRALGMLVRRGYELELAHEALRIYARRT